MKPTSTPRNRKDMEFIVLVGATILLILVAIAFPFICAHFESKTYNKLTGANTTMWDALWVELRVQDQPK